MNASTFTKSGGKASAPAKLDKDIFGLTVENHDLLKQAYLAYLANGRENNAVVKTRGLVRGGGRKPWKQKGTGRARFGSTRNPIWRGGGIVFGPTGQENYSRNMNVAAKRTAIRQALSLKAEQVRVIESFDNKEAKTSQTASLLQKIGVKRNVLLVVDAKDELVTRATRNLPELTVVQAKYLNVFDILNADNIVVTKKSLELIQEWLGGKK